MMKKPLMFVGPSLTILRENNPGLDIDLLLQDYELMPPATCGSVESVLNEAGEAGTLIIVDGYIDTRLSVGHVELCNALDLDWQLWGLCDLGAIRAYELRDEGMIAYGDVGLYLEENIDCCDDEIIWSFDPEAPYTVHNEPLLHLRKALQFLRNTAELPEDTAHQILQEMAALWYKERDWDIFIGAVNRFFPALSTENSSTHSMAKQDFQLKVLDLARFLREQPWREWGET